MAKKKVSSVDVDRILVMIALIVLNVLFVVHFLVGWIVALLGLIVGSIAVVVSGFAIFIASLYFFVSSVLIGPSVLFASISPFAMMFISIAMICLGGLWMIGNYYLVKYSYMGVAWYVKLNIRVFKKYEP